jgi:tetratricopeptide (TPR) repeat protein
MLAQEMNAFQTGLMHYSKMDLDEAIVALYDAVAEDPSDMNAWYYRGLTREAIGEHTGALSDINKALSLSPDNVNFLISRARVLKSIGQRQRAITDLERAVFLKPDPRTANSALLLLGVMHVEQNSYKQATLIYDQLVELTPDDPIAYYFRGLSLSHIGEHEKALLDYQKSVALDDTSADTYEAIAIEHIHLGNQETGCNALMKAEELGSSNARTLISSFCK